MNQTVLGRATQYLLTNPGKSATQIAKVISENPGNVSSILLKAVKAGKLERLKTEDNHGPSGGYVYYVVSR